MRAVLGKLTLLGLGCLLTFIVLEVGVRVMKTSSNDIFVDDRAIVHRYKANLDEMHVAEVKTPVHLKTNELGFAGPTFAPVRDPGTLRIASLGDSFTAAVEVDYDKKYSALLAEQLRQEGIKAESLNFGVAGQGTGHALATYMTYVRPTKPDVVILWFFMGNDFEDNLTYAEGIEDGTDSDEMFLKRILRKSELAHFVVNKLVHIPVLARLMNGTVLNRVGNDTEGGAAGLPLTIRLMFTRDDENEDALSKTRTYLSALQDAVVADGARLLVVAVPVSFQVSDSMRTRLIAQYPELPGQGFDIDRPRFALNALINELGIPYLDLSPGFQEGCARAEQPEDRCALYNCAFCHLSTEGHVYAAEAVSRRLLGDPGILSRIADIQ